MNTTFAIKRENENTFAIVQANFSALDKSRESFFRNLNLALSTWFESPQGIKAWESSCDDFNIGDLVHELGDELLTTILNENLIFDLSITTDTVDDVIWSFDTVLGQA